MLNHKDKKQIVSTIDGLITELKNKAVQLIEVENEPDVIQKSIVDITVKKLTPQSKILLNRVYNMLKDDSFKEDFFVQHKAAFYDKDILGQLNKKFIFEIPNKIDLKSCSDKVDKLKKSGAVCIAGGAVSFVAKSSVPICIAIIIAGLMLFVSRGSNNTKNVKKDIHVIINNYFESVKKALLNWVESIEIFYDQQIEEIEREFSL